MDKSCEATGYRALLCSFFQILPCATSGLICQMLSTSLIHTISLVVHSQLSATHCLFQPAPGALQQTYPNITLSISLCPMVRSSLSKLYTFLSGLQPWPFSTQPLLCHLNHNIDCTQDLKFLLFIPCAVTSNTSD